MATFRFVQWLMEWIESQAGFAFEWDLGNLTKNFKKHGISRFESESVFEQVEAVRILGEQITPKTTEILCRAM